MYQLLIRIDQNTNLLVVANVSTLGEGVDQNTNLKFYELISWFARTLSLSCKPAESE
jgi:hypothetical protein